MPSTVLLAVVMTIGAGYVFLKALVYLTQDPKEPPVVAGKIPFISPAIGIATEKANYYVRMRWVIFKIDSSLGLIQCSSLLSQR